MRARDYAWGVPGDSSLREEPRDAWWCVPGESSLLSRGVCMILYDFACFCGSRQGAHGCIDVYRCAQLWSCWLTALAKAGLRLRGFVTSWRASRTDIWMHIVTSWKWCIADVSIGLTFVWVRTKTNTWNYIYIYPWHIYTYRTSQQRPGIRYLNHFKA